MKRYLLLLTFSISYFITYSQGDAVVIKHPNGDHIQGTVNIKLLPEFREYFEKLNNNLPGFESLQITSIHRKFPNRKPPVNEYHKSGVKIPDLSLIYELDYVAEKDAFKVSEDLMISDYFEFVEPNFVSYPLFNVNDPRVAQYNPYHLNTLQLYTAWDITQGDTNVVIGYTDTSFDLYHEDLKDNGKKNYADPIDGIDNDNDGHPDNFRGWDLADDDSTLFINNEIHGTTVLAVGSATTNNNVGIAGSGFKCKYWPVKVANSSQVITKGYEGIVDCVDHGCKIVNCSWGNTTFNLTAQNVTDAVTLQDDVLIIASAGNIPYDTAYYPATYRYVLSVTGVDALDRYDPPSNAPFSRHDSVDVSAPGFNVYTTATWNGSPLYTPPQGGTSIAAPLVAGVAGLVRSYYPTLDAIETGELIKCTTDNIDGVTENVPYAGKIGSGRVNANTAVTSTICGPVSINEEKNEAKMIIFPNPATNNITVSLMSAESSQSKILFLNTAGEQVISINNISSQKGKLTHTIDVSELAAGIYFLQLQTENNLFIQKVSILK